MQIPRLALLAAPVVILAALSTGQIGHADPAKAAAHASKAPVAKLKRADVERSLRRYLDERMADHASQMGALWSAVILLDFEAAAAQASRLRNTPRLARPSAETKGLGNDMLPASFYDLQDALYEASGELEKQAKSRDAGALGVAFSNVTRVCVGCHSVYLGLPAAKTP